MKRKDLLKIIVGFSLVAVLALSIPLMSGCTGGTTPEPEPEPTPEPTPEPEPEPEPEPTPEPEPAKEVVAKIGFLAPLTGPSAGWGLPGLNGDRIWAKHFNDNGGITLSDGTHITVELVPYDNEYMADKAITGGKKLVLEDECVMVQMLGGHTAAAIVPWFTQKGVLSTTLLPSDLTPDTLYHLAPVEVCPFYNVTGVEWLGLHLDEIRPDLTEDGVITFAQAAQDDELGRPGMAAMNAAAEGVGMEIVYTELFDPATTDFAPIVSEMIDSGADIISWGISYPDYVNLMTLEAYNQGFEGQLHSCTLDFYDAIVDKTSVEFMENFVWQFPDFDDPMMSDDLNPYSVMSPNDFWDEYNADYPGTWSAVSWEYQGQLDQWAQAVIVADSIEPMAVFDAWKANGDTIYHPFGKGTWWGKPFWGIDNALMAPWPVVVMKDGKATIVEFRDQLDWWNRNAKLMVEWNEHYGEMFYQRMGITKEEAEDMYGFEYPE